MTDEPGEGTPRLADIRTGPLRRGMVTLAVILAILGLFLWMVGNVFLAFALGTVAAVYLWPLTRWMERRVNRRGVAAAAAMVMTIVPVVVIVIYSYAELNEAVEYLQANPDAVAGELTRGLERLPLIADDVDGAVESAVRAGVEGSADVPGEIREALAGFLVAAGIFLFTAYYLLTDWESVVSYLRESIPEAYAPLTEALERNVTGVLFGTIDAVFATQAIKAGVVLLLNLSLGVPLPFTLAALAFVIGLFPVLGTWTVYVPAAAYLLVFEEAPVRAGIMVGMGFVLSTVVLSLWVRPKIGARRSHVLNVYWMFVGLVAGAYAFGAVGVVVGPLLIGVLKAALDTFRAPDGWVGRVPDDPDAPEAELLTESELERAKS